LLAGKLGDVKTTFDLPDDLVRTIKIRAVQERRKLKDVVADLLRLGLAVELGEPTAVRERVQLPLVQCAHPADPGTEVTPDRAAQILLDEESHRAAT
jgi:plasmid stability protein